VLPLVRHPDRVRAARARAALRDPRRTGARRGQGSASPAEANRGDALRRVLRRNLPGLPADQPRRLPPGPRMTERPGQAGGGGADGGPEVMKVRTELVLEQLVSRVLGRALELRSSPVPANVEKVLEAAPEPRELARLGYACRIAETEMFEPARSPMPW